MDRAEKIKILMNESKESKIYDKFKHIAFRHNLELIKLATIYL